MFIRNGDTWIEHNTSDVWKKYFYSKFCQSVNISRTVVGWQCIETSENGQFVYMFYGARSVDSMKTEQQRLSEQCTASTGDTDSDEAQNHHSLNLVSTLNNYPSPPNATKTL